MKTLMTSVLALVVLAGCGGWHQARGQCAQAAAQPAPQVIVVQVPPGSTVIAPPPAK